MSVLGIDAGFLIERASERLAAFLGRVLTE
jgi:hypothetical protein